MIGDLHTVALVGTDGTIDWYCPGRFDAPSMFAAILDAGRGGHFRICPARDGHNVKQLYLPDTNVLITRFLTADGVGEVQDFMPIHRDPHHAKRLVRRVIAVRGQMDFRAGMPSRGSTTGGWSTPSTWQRARRGVPAGVPAAPDASLGDPAHDHRATASLRIVHPAQRRQLQLRAGACRERAAASTPSARRSLTTAPIAPSRYWRRVAGPSKYRGRWREMVNRSALTLKLLTYRADRCDRRRPHHQPARGDRRRPQLGLSLHLDPRRAPSRCTRCCASASPRRPPRS